MFAIIQKFQKDEFHVKANSTLSAFKKGKIIPLTPFV